MALVRQRIRRGGERLWQLDDFRDLSFAAVAQALSRLKREGEIELLAIIKKRLFLDMRPMAEAVREV